MELNTIILLFVLRIKYWNETKSKMYIFDKMYAALVK